VIFGLTHSNDGIPRQRLTVAYKASIGVPGTDSKKYPEKLDHFRIVAKNEKGDWVEDSRLQNKLIDLYCTKIKGEEGQPDRTSKLREFDIVFLEDPPQVALQNGMVSYDLESLFRTELAFWTATERKCFGNGKEAQRSVTMLSKEDAAFAGPDARYVKWSKCGDGCPEYETGKCKPTAALNFIFKDHPVMGSVANFKTTSFESIQRIQGSLMQILQTTGGRLRGIPLKMVLRPGKTTYTNPEGKRVSGNAFFVNIEFRHEDWTKLVPQLMEQSATYALNMKRSLLLTEHVDQDEIDIDPGTEHEQAREMTTEFYPDAAAYESKTTLIKDDGLDLACSALKLNAAQKDTMLGVFKGDVEATVEWAGRFLALAKASGKNDTELHALFSKALLMPGAMEGVFKPVKEAAAPPAAKTTAKKKVEPAKPAETAAGGEKANWSF
jgi:hypothetical protein